MSLSVNSLLRHLTLPHPTLLHLSKSLHKCSFVSPILWGFPGGVRNADSIHALGRSPGGGNGNPLHYSCQENPMDRGAWRDTVHGVAKSRTQTATDTSTLPGVTCG